jgi:hypothetical protein
MDRYRFVRVQEFDKAFTDLTCGECFRFGRSNREYMYINKYTYSSLKTGKQYKISNPNMLMVVVVGYFYEL